MPFQLQNALQALTKIEKYHFASIKAKSQMPFKLSDMKQIADRERIVKRGVRIKLWPTIEVVFIPETTFLMPQLLRFRFFAFSFSSALPRPQQKASFFVYRRSRCACHWL
jgi:hypothetical protein